MIDAKAKEAIKTALAFTLAYGFALNTGWLKPMWVGLTVAVIAMPSAGQSLQRGALRLAGTVPGCIVPFVIFGVAAQERWLALALTCAWMFVTTYMMLSRPATSYLWNVAGFTSLIIMTGGFESTAELFSLGETRTVATIVGIIIYTLVTTFLWPRSNAGAIRKALSALYSTQRARLLALRTRSSDPEAAQELRKLRHQETQQLMALRQALQAEGSESYQVRELRPWLSRLVELAATVMDRLDRLETAAPTGDLLQKCVPTVDDLLDELESRLASMVSVVSADDGTTHPPTSVPTSLDRDALEQLRPLDRAAVLVATNQLSALESVTAEAASLLAELEVRGRTPSESRVPSRVKESNTRIGFALDDLRGAFLVSATVAVGFAIWVFVNPPGHAGWVVLPGVVAMMVAQTPQLNATVFLRPTAIALALGIAVYVLLLPRISTFWELGTVLFLAMFAVNYRFDGIGKFAGMVGVLLGISIQQQQTYSFAAAANTYVYVLSSFLLVYAMSYLIQAPRPEKAALSQVRRFFRSARFLIESTSDAMTGRRVTIRRWRVAWHREQLGRLPDTIAHWSKVIRVDGSSAQAGDVDDWIVGLRSIAYRIDELIEARVSVPTEPQLAELTEDIQAWRRRLEDAVRAREQRPEERPTGELRKRVAGWRDELEARIAEARAEGGAETVADEEWTRFYRLLGGYRGVSEALMAYDERALRIDWAAWREERFS